MSAFSADNPLRVAIVGSGPSGFYAAEALFKKSDAVAVDMFDRLPTPFGLVRGGVAPDHHKIKNVTKKYDKVAAHARFRFLGNVEIGRDLPVDEMRSFYDAILFCSGAETDRRLAIPGENLVGSHTATEFVGWYNGHPDYRGRVFDLSQEVAVVIGQGNVAMDVVRILAKTQDELASTDIAAHALEQLAESKIKEIHMIGRRGPAQAKFTPPELRELGELADANPVVRADDLELNAASAEELEHKDAKPNRENMALMQEFAGRDPAGKGRRVHLHFFKSPVQLLGHHRVEGVRLERNALSGDAFKQRASGTGEIEELACGLFFRSVGYRGRAMPDVPFNDKWGVFPNEAGRIGNGLYCAGWIKRGPSGVIGTNKPDAVETVESLLADQDSLAPAELRNTGILIDRLKDRGVRVVSYQDWQKIDAAEVARGQANGKPREKFTTIIEMLEALK